MTFLFADILIIKKKKLMTEIIRAFLVHFDEKNIDLQTKK